MDGVLLSHPHATSRCASLLSAVSSRPARLSGQQGQCHAGDQIGLSESIGDERTKGSAVVPHSYNCPIDGCGRVWTFDAGKGAGKLSHTATLRDARTERPIAVLRVSPN